MKERIHKLTQTIPITDTIGEKWDRQFKLAQLQGQKDLISAVFLIYDQLKEINESSRKAVEYLAPDKTEGELTRAEIEDVYKKTSLPNPHQPKPRKDNK